MSDISKRLRDLADELEALDDESAAPARPWPPTGVAIEIKVDANGTWKARTAAGDGYYYYPNGGFQSLRDTPWRYAPAAWEIAHDNAKVWIVNNRSSQGWLVSCNWKVGDIWNGGTIVHVEYREDVE